MRPAARFLPPVDSRYGAPMGRHNRGRSNNCEARSIHVFRVYLDNGGYDIGGAYWGHGQPIYCATDGLEYFETVRARNRDEALISLDIDEGLLKVGRSTTAVIYRQFADGDSIAFFPHLKQWRDCVMSFQHVGQHSGASRDLMRDLAPATADQKRALKNELESPPYFYRLREVRK